MLSHLNQAGQGHTACGAPAAKDPTAQVAVGWEHPGLRHVGPSELGFPAPWTACLPAAHSLLGERPECIPGRREGVPALPCTRPPSSWLPPPPSLGDKLAEVLGKKLCSTSGIRLCSEIGPKGQELRPG